MDQKTAITKVAELMKGAKFASLTTMTAEGQHVSRPMGVQQVEFDGDLWFFAYEDSNKVAQIRQNPQVNASINNGNNWISLSGAAEVVHNRQKAEELWSTPLKAWFPEGIDQPGLTLIKINAETAEYWDTESNKVTYAFKLAKAIATNTQADVGQNETVRLDEK